MLLYSRNGYLSLQLFESEFFCICQLIFSIFQVSLIWPKPRVCWWQLLSQTRNQFIQRYCKRCEVVSSLSRRFISLPEQDSFCHWIIALRLRGGIPQDIVNCLIPLSYQHGNFLSSSVVLYKTMNLQANRH